MVFYNEKMNWISFYLKFVLILNIIGIIFLYLDNIPVSITWIVIFTVGAILMSTYILLKHVSKIEIDNVKIKIKTSLKNYVGNIVDCEFHEKKMLSRMMKKYNQLIITSRDFGKTFKLDSLSWMEYDKLKDYLITNNLLEVHSG